jgi:bifunctional UDP-N-acetylglucosamine pyrophosphorylase/glucosamine-1-phosphate N-acetyltransferase
MIENAEIGKCCLVGPYAHLRPKAKLGNFVKLGNFCEVKNSIIGDYCKVSHLTYVGDAEIGKKCNIGCGVIFVNYNGKIKSKTTIGDNCFIGSNTNIIAPVNIGEKAYICAGTTIDKSVDSNSFVIGRSKQIEKKDRAKDYITIE